MRDAQDVDVLSRHSAGRALRRSLPVAAAVIVADQLTKWWALETLRTESIDLVLGARFHLVFNNGAAFARGTGFGPVLGVLALIMTVVLLVLSSRRPDRFGQVLFGAVAGGAVGNLLDRIFRADDGPLSGAVVDFVDLGWWPVFNVADSAIVVGVIGIIAHAFIVGEPEPEPATDGPDPESGDIADPADADGGRDPSPVPGDRPE